MTDLMPYVVIAAVAYAAYRIAVLALATLPAHRERMEAERTLERERQRVHLAQRDHWIETIAWKPIPLEGDDE